MNEGDYYSSFLDFGGQDEGCVAVQRQWGMCPGVATSRGQDLLEASMKVPAHKEARAYGPDAPARLG